MLEATLVSDDLDTAIATLDSAARDGAALGTFVSSFRDASGIEDEKHLASIAEKYLDKLYADQTEVDDA